MAASVFMPIKSTSAITPSGTIDNTPAVGVSLSDIDFGGISTDSSGTIRTVSNTAIVNSSIYGYELYISSANNDSNALIRSGTTGTSPSEIIPASSTTDITAPTVLSHDTWGFAVQRRNTTINSGSEDVLPTAAFDTTYTTGDNSNPNNKFVALPTLGNKVLIAERSTSATNVPTNIYYGINVTTNTPSGLYQGTVTYTAIGKAPTTHTITLKLIPGVDQITIGDTECNASNSTASTDAGDPAGTKQCEVTLTYGYGYDLTATIDSHYTFSNWTTNNSIGSFADANSSTTTFTAGQGNTSITPNVTPNPYTQTTEVRYENADGTWGSYTTVDTKNVNYGESYSWSTSQISGFDSTAYQAASVTSYTVTGAHTNQVSIYRTKFALTINRNTSYISSVTGAGSYRWGETVNISATASDGNEFTSWSQTAGTTGTFGSTTSASTTFTMGKGVATIYADGKTIPIMQDFTLSMCQSQASSKSVTVRDRRDNKDYTVRYINGNCWMTSNLRITGTISATDSNFTGPDVNISEGDLTAGDSYDQPRTHTGVDNNGDPTVWYNYAAASAKTITGSSNSTSVIQDICPKGWRIFTKNERDGLINSIGSSPAAFNPVRGGYYSNGSHASITNGYWWTTTVASSSDRYPLLYENNLATNYNDYGAGRFIGYFVRCIRENRSVSDVTYMQEVNSGVVNNTTEGATATLTDQRDSQQYTVAKINGNLWMTRNLAIGCNGSGSTYGSNASSKSLNVADSNIASTWSTSTASLDLGNDYTLPRIVCSSTYGAWYNYAFVTAETIVGSDNSTNDVYSICPKNWRLPTGNEQSSITGYKDAYVSVSGGLYDNGSLYSTEYGAWWSATSNTISSRLFLVYDSNALNIRSSSRDGGRYARCISSA